jgi:hypothetical protein
VGAYSACRNFPTQTGSWELVGVVYESKQRKKTMLVYDGDGKSIIREATPTLSVWVVIFRFLN